MAFFHHEMWDRIDSHVSNPDIRRLLWLWQEARPAEGGVPDAAGFPLDRLANVAPHLMRLRRDGEADFFYEHYGRAVAFAANRDMTGQTTRGFDSELAAFFRRCYHACLERGRPLYTVHKAVHACPVHTWERLILPLERDGEDVLLVYNRPLEERGEMLQAVLESSPSAVLCLRAMRGEDGEIVDFAYDAANERAAYRAGLPRDELLRSTLTTAPALWDHDVFARYRRVVATGEPYQIEDRDEAQGFVRWSQINVVKSGDGVAVTISDVTPYKRVEAELRARQADLEAANRRLESTRERLLAEIDERRELEQELRSLASRDALTGLGNRRYFLAQAQTELARARRSRVAPSLLLIDVDHFKRVNDDHGHDVGDAVLIAIADVLRANIREVDHVARFGGEEFVVLLPETDTDAAVAVAERLRGRIATAPFPGATGPLAVTVSVGVGTLLRHEAHTRDLFKRADRALYEAKRAGRNRVVRQAEPGPVGGEPSGPDGPSPSAAD